jgi:predicted acetyltransferase
MTERVTIRCVRTEAEVKAYAELIIQALWGTEPPSSTWLERFCLRENWKAMRLALRGRELRGGLRFLRFGQWFGGRSVPMVGITTVAVPPDARGSGVASALMTSALRELHAEGVALSGLYPATVSLYRKSGYETAGQRVQYEIRTADLRLGDRGLEVRPFRTTDLDAVRLAYAARAGMTSGNLDRSDWAWQRVTEGAHAKTYGYVVAGRRGLEGHVFFTQAHEEPLGYRLIVHDLVALTPRAARRILTLLGDHASVGPRVLYFGAPCDPVLQHLPEQVARVAWRWDWMLRLVDVPAALAARGYPSGVRAEVHLDVQDDVLRGNAGRLVLRVADGRATVERGGGRGRVRAHVRGLASLYSGYLSAQELAVVGLVTGPAADLTALSSCFAGPAPWMPDMF